MSLPDEQVLVITASVENVVNLLKIKTLIHI